MRVNESSANRLAFTIREPIGVIASISAFNHPLNLIIHQTVPAIAVGAPVIVKPATTTPMSCLAFMGILREAGLDERWWIEPEESRALLEEAELTVEDAYGDFDGTPLGKGSPSQIWITRRS